MNFKETLWEEGRSPENHQVGESAHWLLQAFVKDHKHSFENEAFESKKEIFVTDPVLWQYVNALKKI